MFEHTNKTTLYVQADWDQTLTSADKSDPWWNAFSSACEQMYVLGVDHQFLTLCYGFGIKSENNVYVLLWMCALHYDQSRTLKIVSDQ